MLEIAGVTKEYSTPGGPVAVLAGVSLSLNSGDAAVIMGPSGAGKSTLLYLAGGLEPPSSGRVSLNSENPYQLAEKQLAQFRNQKVGFLFQDHCLLPQCTVLENVMVPCLVTKDGTDYTSRARKLLDQVGLGGRLGHRPAELSGGEKQRAALARALIRRPLLLLCDEPTGNLDEASAGVVADLLLELHHQQETILMVVTHSTALASRFTLRYDLHHANLHPSRA